LPVAVSTRTASPALMNSGTKISMPLSSVASFSARLTLVLVLSGRGDLQLDALGKHDVHRSAVVGLDAHAHVRAQKARAAAEDAAREGNLLEGVGVHEIAVVAVGVEVLPAGALEPDALEPLVGPEAPLDHRAAAELLELRVHRAGELAAAGMVLRAENLAKASLEADYHPGTEVGGGDHCNGCSWRRSK
jgi:hypothetical protein